MNVMGIQKTLSNLKKSLLIDYLGIADLKPAKEFIESYGGKEISKYPTAISIGIVLPHEKTHKGPKIDRLNMLKTTKHTLETGFILYSDPEGKTTNLFDEVSQGSPLIEHNLWLPAVQEILPPCIFSLRKVYNHQNLEY